MCRPRLILLIVCFCGVWPDVAARAAGSGELTLTVVDADTGRPIPCRMHLRNEKDRPQRVAKMPFWHDHFVFPGTVKIKLPRGTYHFEIEHGPEYVTSSGRFIMESQSKDQKSLELRRACNMADEGWWSGDLHLHRAARDAELLMLADDLHVAGLVTWSEKKNEWASRSVPAEPVKKFDGNRYCDLLGGESAGEGGTLLFLNCSSPLLVEGPAADRHRLGLLSAAREQPSVWIDVARSTAWDLPLWLAGGRVDSIELCDDQYGRTKMTDDTQGRHRDKKLMPGATGVGRWTHQIYYHVLNCGLRIPPSAGSGSGESANPVGYNRVYVWVDKDQFDYDAWWKAYRLGRVVVTNGPLIRPVANGRFPGHVFQVPAGERFSIDVAINVANRDPITYFELVKNGRIAQSVRYDELAKTGRFAPVAFEESGWLLVRAVTDVEGTYRFATSAPWYVEVGDERKRVSNASVQFFIDWLNERRAALSKENTASSADIEKAWQVATAYWEKLAADANAD